MSIIQPFVWGSGGAKLSPEQIARRREAEDVLLSKGIDASPVGHWTQGLARVLNAAGGAYRRSQLDKAEADSAAFSSAEIAGALERYSARNAILAASGASAEMAATVPRASTGGTINLSGDRKTFVDTLLPAAMEESKRTGIDPRIIVAQAAQETGWGKSAPGNNFFGIKSHGKDGGQNFATHEYVKGNRVRVNDSFRTYGIEKGLLVLRQVVGAECVE